MAAGVEAGLVMKEVRGESSVRLSRRFGPYRFGPNDQM
jgi:hypothetical protein